MALVYDEFEPRGKFPARLDPIRQFRKHAENWFFLHAITIKGSFMDKRQAAKELIICERKMDYWRRHPAFSVEQEASILTELRKQWAR